MGNMNKPHAEDLFRQQAIDALSKRPFSRPIARPPRPWFWVTALVVCLVIAASSFLGQAEYARKESARGWLVADKGVVRIRHDHGADVTAILRQPGDFVETGDAILTLGQDRILDDGSNSHTLQRDELLEQIAAVGTQMSLLRRMGCDAIQGYLISRPVPEPDFLKLLKSSRQATG